MRITMLHRTSPARARSRRVQPHEPALRVDEADTPPGHHVGRPEQVALGALSGLSRRRRGKNGLRCADTDGEGRKYETRTLHTSFIGGSQETLKPAAAAARPYECEAPQPAPFG
jgi:hypothetical protein